MDPKVNSRRGKTYRRLGAFLFALGILWNLVGTQFGSVPANAAIGFVALLAGVFYWIKGRRMNF